MAHFTLRQAIQRWQQRLDLTGLGLVETALVPGPARDQPSDPCATFTTSIDATLAQLAQLTPSQFTIELAFPQAGESRVLGVFSGITDDACDDAFEWSETWSPAAA